MRCMQSRAVNVMAWVVRVVAVSAWIGAIGCDVAEPPDLQFRCSAEAACPEGQGCNLEAGLCQLPDGGIPGAP